MASSYPSGLDALTNPTSTDRLNGTGVGHAQQHANANDAIEAIQGELGLLPKGSKASVRARLDDLDTSLAGVSASVTGRVLDQDVTRRSGIVGQARIAEELVVDVVLGDSIARGSGGSYGTTDWPSVLSVMENRSAGEPDPGVGLKLCNYDDGLYGSLKWDSLAQGASGTHGPSINAGWTLSAAGQVIGDTDDFRRAEVFYVKQATGAASIEVSIDGGSTWTAAVSTAGTGVGSVLSADAGSVATRTLQVRQSGTGSVKVAGYRPYQTDATAGQIVDNIARGGSSTQDWLDTRDWEAHLTAVAPRRVYIALGGNDAFADETATDTMARLATIVARAQAAAPLAEVVVFAEYRPTRTDIGKIAPAAAEWASDWVEGWQGVAADAGASLVDLWARFGDVGDDAADPDPYSLTMDAGLHFDDAGQRAIAELVSERLGLSSKGLLEAVDYLARANHTGQQTASTISDLETAVNGYIATVLGGNVTIGGSGLVNSPFVVTGTASRAQTLVNAAGAGLNIYVGSETYPRASFGHVNQFNLNGIFIGAGTTDVDTFLFRSAAGEWSLAGGKIGTAGSPTASGDLTTKGYVDARTPAATTGAAGLVELATDAETTTGTDTARAVTPAGAAATYPKADEIRSIVVVTQAEYDALTPSATTLYVVIG